jgi:hypothetical protein
MIDVVICSSGGCEGEKKLWQVVRRILPWLVEAVLFSSTLYNLRERTRHENLLR